MKLSVRDVAQLLSVSEKTIYRWVNQNFIPAYRINDQYRFNRAEILEWATSRRINVSAEIFEEPESSSTPMPGFTEALNAGGIFYRLDAADKQSSLKAIVDHLRLPEEVDRDFLFRVLLSREALASTGIGGGIAIPHVRNPVVLHVTRPTISLFFLEKPIEFDAIDGQPVHALFSVISPTVRAHLYLLSRLAYALHDPGFKEVVSRQGSREEILREAKRVEDNLGKAATIPAFPEAR